MLINVPIESMPTKDQVGKALVVLGGLWGATKLISGVKLKLLELENNERRRSYRDKCRAMIAEVDEMVKENGITTEQVDLVISLPFEELLRKLHSGELQPSYVLLAYQSKALEAHKRTNCLIHPIPSAIERARELDQSSDRNLPLFGIPVSVKDDTTIGGYPSTLGSVNLLDSTIEEDCHLIKSLQKQGAIIFMKTNLPQLTGSYQCNNPMFGETLHPTDPLRTPGGSSGGEAALIASGGSILGIGSDIAGSLREPAHFTGVCTLKPTAERVAHKGQLFSDENAGQSRLQSCIGPMSRDVETLVAFSKAVFNDETYANDMFAPPLTFRDQIYQKEKQLKIGLCYNDELFPVTPACKRAVQEAKAALIARGHKVVEWTPPDLLEGRKLYLLAANCDNLQGMSPYLHGDITDWCVWPYAAFNQGYSRWYKRLKLLLISKWDKMKADFLKYSFGTESLLDYWATGSQQNEWCRRIEESFREAELDAFLCPAWPTVSPWRGYWSELEMKYMGPHSHVWNVLNVPVGVLPVTKVTKEDVAAMNTYKGEMPQWLLKNIHEEIKTGIGLPLGVQIGAMRYEEEIVLKTMMELQEGIKLA